MKWRKKEYRLSELSCKNRLKYQGRPETIEQCTKVIEISIIFFFSKHIRSRNFLGKKVCPFLGQTNGREGKNLQSINYGSVWGGYRATAYVDGGTLWRCVLKFIQTILKKWKTVCCIRSPEASNIDPRISKKCRNKFDCYLWFY